VKQILHDKLCEGRAALLSRLDGLGEYDLRRPMTPTGTNLLGLVKHLAVWEFRYFGDVFGRPAAEVPPWPDENGMWAAADESGEDITGWYRRAWAHADATIGALSMDAVGHVPWWGNAEVTLHHIMVHVVVDTQRHAGHADIVRELIDGTAGLLPGADNMPERDEAGWARVVGDVDHLAGMSASLGGEVKASEQAAYAVVGHEFNLGSPKQLQEVLFTELGLPKTKRIKTGYTTDSEALTSLLAQTEHPILAHLLRHRDVARLKSIVDSLIPMAGVDGRIHTTYNQTIAATGRLSSTDPNLQNIPIRTEEGRRTRQAFIVGAGYETLLTADYSQIELRIMAHLSGDQALADAFTSGHDFHAETASRVFGVQPEEVTVELRSKIKAMNYGLAYGLSSYGLSQQLRVSRDEASAFMDDYFEQFGGIRDYLEGIVAQARMDGYTQTILGRRRYLPDLVSDNRQRREMAERMALNAPIQGSAADVIKVAMLAVHRRIREQGLRSRMLLQVHDELLFEVAFGELDQLKELVHAEMCGAFELTVPLEVSMGTGRSWADAAH